MAVVVNRRLVILINVFPEFDHGADAAAAVDGRAPSTAAWKPQSGFHKRPPISSSRDRGDR